jgi:hypothetical protein
VIGKMEIDNGVFLCKMWNAMNLQWVEEVVLKIERLRGKV